MEKSGRVQEQKDFLSNQRKIRYNKKDLQSLKTDYEEQVQIRDGISKQIKKTKNEIIAERIADLKNKSSEQGLEVDALKTIQECIKDANDDFDKGRVEALNVLDRALGAASDELVDMMCVIDKKEGRVE